MVARNVVRWVSSRARSVRHVWTHPANREARFAGLWRVLWFSFSGRISGSQEAVLLDCQGIRILVRPGDYRATKVICGCPPDYQEMRVWERFHRPGDTFVNVGANIGLYSLWAASEGADVGAFGPSVDSWGALMDNLTLDPWKVDDRKIVMDSLEGQACLTVGADTMNRVVLVDDSQQESSLEGVEASMLCAQVSGKVRGLKVDVEGSEGPVLQGAEGLLEERLSDLVQFEWNGMSQTVGDDRRPTADEILRRNNYRLYRLEGGRGSEIVDLVPPPGTDIFALSPDISVFP